MAEGDIINEEADVIVNITNKTFNLKTGILLDIYVWKQCMWLEGLDKEFEAAWLISFFFPFLPLLQTYFFFHSVVFLLRVQLGSVWNVVVNLLQDGMFKTVEESKTDLFFNNNIES